jgi:hypothetical protein
MAQARRQSSSNARDADFLGEGTSSGPAAPIRPVSPDGLFYLDNGEPTPKYFQQAAAVTEAARQTGGVNYGPGGTFRAARPNLQGLSLDPATAQEAARQQGQAIDARKARDGGLLGDLARLGTYYASSGPIFDAVGAYSPDVVADIASIPRSIVDEAADQIIPGGSGAYGRNIVPTVGRTGGDSFFPSETIQSGTLRDGYGGVATSGNTGIISGLIDGVPGYPFGDMVSGAFNSPFNNGNQGGRVATYTPTMGTNGGSALTPVAQGVVNRAEDFYRQNQTQSQADRAQAANYANRAAPQMAMPSSANQQAVYDRAMNFQADTSGAQRLENMQFDMQGINNLESWSPQYSMQGVNNLESFSPTNSQQGVNNLLNFRPTYAEQAFAGLENFNAGETLRSAADLRNYVAQDTRSAAARLNLFDAREGQKAATQLLNYDPVHANSVALQLQQFAPDRSGIDRMNAYADEAQGPSAAQAMLRSQSDQDKRTMLAMARSGRGGPAAAMQAQRQAMTEGSLISAETRGQGAVLAAQEYDAYKNRQLQALAQAGSMISAAEAQRLTALSNAGQIRSAQDAQKLAALQAYAQVQTTRDSQMLSAQQSAGQLYASADTNRLGALTSAGQLSSNADSMRLSGMQTAGQMRTAADSQMLGATSNAAQLQGQMDSQILNARTNAAQLRSTMDAQGLSAISTAAGLRGQNDQIRSSNLQAAGNIRLQGSALNLNALSLAGNISTEMRNQDITVLRSNLDAQLQTLGLNDNQVRFFNQMASDRDMASQNLVMQANALGINASQAQSALDLQWNQFAFNQLTTQQQMEFQRQQAGINNARANRQEVYGLVGGLISGIGSLFGGGGGGGGGGSSGGGQPAAPVYLPQVPQFNLSMPSWNNVGAPSAGGYASQAGLAPLQLTMPTYQTPYQQSQPTYENQL